jgi:hypothetical protein
MIVATSTPMKNSTINDFLEQNALQKDIGRVGVHVVIHDVGPVVGVFRGHDLGAGLDGGLVEDL